MARYTGRFTSVTSGSATPKFFSLGKSLAQRRGGLRPKTVRPAPSKPSLTTTKQKEAEIQKTLDKNYMPSGLRLAKLRQLAAQHKILGSQARDFLHRSAGGVKQQGTEGLKKFESELMEAEREVIGAQGGHDPMKFEYRKDADHPERLAKKMVKGLYHEAAEEAEKSTATQHQTMMEERQARLATIHSVLDRGQPAATTPAVPTAATPTPTLQQPMPLPTTSRLTFTPLAGGSHITESATPSSSASVPSTNLGVPTVVRPEAMPTSPPPSSTQPETALVPTPSVEQSVAIPDTPAPSVDVQLPDTSHLSDPFGGED